MKAAELMNLEKGRLAVALEIALKGLGYYAEASNKESDAGSYARIQLDYIDGITRNTQRSNNSEASE